MLVAGVTFWIKREDPRHLWVVISDPQIDKDCVLAVNFTTYNESLPATFAENDPACRIQVSEHPFITRETCVFYRGAITFSSEFFASWMEKGAIMLDQPVSAELLARMRRCAGSSKHMVEGHFDILDRQGLTD